MPEKIVIHAAYPTWRKQTLVAMARARELQDEGNDVVLTYCNAKAGTCAVNYVGSPLTCRICQSGIRRTAAELGLQVVPLEAHASKEDAATVSLSEKKSLLEGVGSGLVSTFRMLPADIRRNKLINRIKRRYMRTSMGLLVSLKKYIAQHGADRIEVFNGRHACSRFCIIAAELFKIPFTTLEITVRARPVLFPGHSPHDRKRIQQRMLSHQPDTALAGEFYRRRRMPRDNRYAKKHSQKFEPPRVQQHAKKISVFLSSQDEFESLGKEWRSPFSEYAGVVQQMCTAHPDYYFCIRFHPNQADITSDILTPFKQIEQLPNAHVYYPRDTANSYTLIEWSDIVVTFGSTIAIEACWMRKPSVILGPSFYDELDVSYTPASVEELNHLLREDLPAKDPTNAARWASYEETEGADFRYLQCQDGKMRPRGFQQRVRLLRRLANYSDDVLCNAIKVYVGSRQPRPPRAA